MADNVRRIVAEFSAKNKAKGATMAFRRDMDSAGQAMKSMAKGALSLVGMGGGLYALKRGFDYVSKAAMKQEDALFLLEAALKATGEYSTGTMRNYEAFAASIQKATVYGDEEVLALMQLMKSLGVTSAGLEQATKMAIGLAAATGRDVRSMSMYIALAQQGEFTMLRRYIPALRSTTDATEQLRIITEFAARGFKIAEAQAETASGSFKQMGNTVSDLAEVVGQPFLDTMAKDAKKATTNIGILTEALKKQKEAVEERIKTEGRLKYWIGPGVPFYAPQVPKDISIWYEKPEAPLAQKSPLVQEAEEYAKILQKQHQEQVAAFAAAQKEQTDMMQEHYDKRIAMGGNYQEMQERMARQRIETDIADVTQQMEAETKTREKAAQDDKELLVARTDAYRAMYGEMGRMTKDVYAAQSEALRSLYKDYEKAGVAEETRNKWLEEQAKILRIKYLQEVGGIAGGFQAAGMQIKREIKTWGDMSYEFSMSFRESIAGGLESTMRDFDNWKEHLLNVFEEVYWSAVRIAAIQPMAGALAGGMTAGLGDLFGGGGSTPTPTQISNLGGYGGGYQYGGIATRPHLAMVGEVPEAFVPLRGGKIPVEMRGGGGGGTDVRIHNEYSEEGERREISRVEEYMISDQRIIEVTMKAMQTNVSYRRSIAQAR